MTRAQLWPLRILAAVDLHSFRELLRVVLRNGKRAAVFSLGVVLVAAGVALLVLPGPGLLLIIAGLAVLATEFAWAEYLLDKAKDQAGKVRSKAGSIRRRPPKA